MNCLNMIFRFQQTLRTMQDFLPILSIQSFNIASSVCFSILTRVVFIDVSDPEPKSLSFKFSGTKRVDVRGSRQSAERNGKEWDGRSVGHMLGWVVPTL